LHFLENQCLIIPPVNVIDGRFIFAFRFVWEVVYWQGEILMEKKGDV